MRTFELQVQTTLDGYMAGPNGEMEMTLPWSDDLDDTPKVVISGSLGKSPWENAVATADPVATVRDLQAQPGRDIITPRSERRLTLSRRGAPGRGTAR